MLLSRVAAPQPSVVALLALAWVCMALGCRAQTQPLGDGPPSADGNVTTLAVFDPAALSGPAGSGLALDGAVAGPPQPASAPPPAVADYGPTAEASLYPTVQVRFNRPMVPLGDKQRIDPKQVGFRIEPAIAGELYWAEPTRLVFTPKTELPRATKYQVWLQSSFATVDGPELDVDLHWTFATPAPRASMWVEYDDGIYGSGSAEPHWKATVALDCDHAPSLAAVRQHLRVTAEADGGDPVPVEVRVTRPKPDVYGYRHPHFRISPVTRWPADSEIVVTLDGELRGNEGPRPIGYATVYSFRTAAGVEALGRHCAEGQYPDGCELGPVVVDFSAPITRAQAQHLSISPRPRGFDALAIDRTDEYGSQPRNAYQAVMLWGQFKRGQVYTIRVDDRLRDIYGQPLVGEREFEVEFIEPPPSLDLHATTGTFAVGLGAKLGIESRHLESLRVRVALLDEATHERLIGQDVQKSGWPSAVAVAREQRLILGHSGKYGWSSHALDVAQFTDGGPGTVFLEVVPEALVTKASGRRTPPARRALVQLTDLGVTVVGSLPGGLVRVARSSDGAAVAGAEVELIERPGGKRRALGQTDAAGLVNLPSSTELTEGALLRVRKGDDQVLLEIAALRRAPAPTDSALLAGESVQTALMTERPLYKPGERVRAMGWAAIATPHEFVGLRQLPSKTRVKLELRDYRDELVAETTVTAKDHGKFWATLDVPESAALGAYQLNATLLGGRATASLQVKDFPVPAFEVSAEATRTDIHGGESTSIVVNASYYFGGRVPIQSSRKVDECVEIDFRPPGLDPSFSIAPRRRYYGAKRGYGHQLATPSVAASPQTPGRLDYDITLHTGIDQQTQRCTHNVAIADISDQQIGAEATIWVHPPFYLAARSPRALDAGDSAEVAIATLDFDGTPITVANVEVGLVRSWSEAHYVTEAGKRRYAGQRQRTQALTPCRTASEGAAQCTFAGLAHGSYEIEIKAKRGTYAPAIHGWFYVRPPAGSSSSWAPTPVKALTVTVDQPAPVAGQTIHARVQAPWSEGSGLLLLSKGGLHERHSFTLDQGAAEIALAVSDAWIPGAELHVLAIEPGAATRTPALRRAQTSVKLASDTRELAVSVTAPVEAQPRERVPIEVRVRDQLGQPVRGHVSVWAVDEAVLSLAPMVLPDFVSTFVVPFSSGLDVVSSYAALLLPFVTRPDPYAPLPFEANWASGTLGWGLIGHGAGGGGYGGAGMGLSGTSGAAGVPPARSKFESAPIFIADAELDERGVAKLRGELPDNLTTFRLTAVASSPLASGAVEARFGTGDARVRVTRPLVVRAAMPRIMRPGDLAEIGVIVDNLRGPAGAVAIELQLHDGDGILELLDSPKAQAQVDAGGQLRLPFRVRALATGTPELELRAVLRPQASPKQPISDGLRLPLPVEPERTSTERVAVYGSLADADKGAALLPFALPTDADPKFGGLSVSVGSTLLGGLEDAVAYLVRYPYGCLEQTASSLLPLIPLGRLAKDYPLGIDDVDHYVAVGVGRLRAMQLADGGFSYWPGGTSAAPYPSAYATWVLGRAAAAGYRVPATMLMRADEYLLGLVARWQTVTGPPAGQDIEMALVLSTLADRGKAPAEALTALYDRRQRLPVFSQATLLLALQASDPQDPRIPGLLGELLSLVDEREAVAKVELTQRWTWYWDSAPRSSAIVLMALLRADPMHPLASKLTRGLLEARRGGRWSNTQENAYALLALADYAAIYEAEEPRFDGRVWLGNTKLASVHVEGRQFNFDDGFTAMSELLALTNGTRPGEDRLILERAGSGRMYYRVGLEWASTAIDKPAKAEGIRLTRNLRGSEGAVGEDQAVRSGDLLAIDVEIEVSSALDHVAINIPLPAGLEAVDLELGKGGAAKVLGGSRGRWVSHQELRRDRAVLFADHLQPGKHHTTVLLRATTPGDYRMPAGQAEMMYYPEVYGRTTGRRLVVR